MTGSKKLVDGLIWILGILVIIILGMAFIPQLLGVAGDIVAHNEHTEFRHPESGDSVREICTQNGPVQQWFNPTTNRWGLLCKMPDGGTGVEIITDEKNTWKEITGFVRRGNKGLLENTEAYLARQGYLPVIFSFFCLFLPGLFFFTLFSGTRG